MRLRSDEVETCLDVCVSCDADASDEGCSGHDFVGLCAVEIFRLACDVEDIACCKIGEYETGETYISMLAGIYDHSRCFLGWNRIDYHCNLE